MPISDVEKYMREHLHDEERILLDVILSARKVQTALWGGANGEWGMEEWRRMFRKRVAKIDEVDTNNPYAHVEVKKRLLQTAALSVALIRIIDELDGLPTTSNKDRPSNLPTFAEELSGFEKENKDTCINYGCTSLSHSASCPRRVRTI